MISKTINYVDYDGEKASEKAYFDMTNIEMTKFVLKYGNKETSLRNYIKQIAEDNNTKGLFELIEDLILSSYGVKSEDGKRFIKNKQKTEEFATSEPYSILFEELFNDPDGFIDFVAGLNSSNGIDKAALKAQAEKEAAALVD